jgi:hypothetical protein
MPKTEQELEELEGTKELLRDALFDNAYIDGDDDEWEPLITELAEKINAFYNRKS